MEQRYSLNNKIQILREAGVFEENACWFAIELLSEREIVREKVNGETQKAIARKRGVNVGSINRVLEKNLSAMAVRFIQLHTDKFK